MKPPDRQPDQANISDEIRSHMADEQRRLARQVITHDVFTRPEYVAGIDVSYHKTRALACASVVVFRADNFTLVDKVFHKAEPTFPYVPQFLAYRERPVIQGVMKQLNHMPDLFFYDGNGIMHDRKCGAASHFGVEYDVPVIGCSKNPAYGTSRLKGQRGDMQHIFLNNEIVGAELITRSDVKGKGIFVSVGHKISLKTAFRLTLEWTPKFRIPEPVRQADQYSRLLLSQ